MTGSNPPPHRPPSEDPYAPRPTGPGDVAVVERLLAAARPGAWTAARLTEELARLDALGAWTPDPDRASGSRRSERAVAVALARVVVDELHVLDVATALDRRRRGLGRSVVEALADHAVRRGCTQAMLELRASNAAAFGLYDGLGFVVVGRRPRYYPDGDSAILMTRRL